jgi:predicted CXXCH cytochrome family protein
MRRISVAIAMIAIGVAVGVLVFGLGTIGEDEGTRGSEDNSYMDSATYVGSDACGCHNTAGWDFKWNHWNASLHSKMIQEPTTLNVTSTFTGTVTLNDTANGIDDVDIILDDTGGVYTADLQGNMFTVDKTVGSQWKQRYLTQIGASLYFLPIQWNEATKEWVPYHLERWFDANEVFITQPSAETDSWDLNCAGCHTTGTNVTYNIPTSDWTVTYSELNIGCEACHGPGSEHVTTQDPDFIWKSVDAQVCGQCHIRGTSNGTYAGGEKLGYPWNDGQGWYMPGDTLSDFYVPGEGTWDDDRNSSKQHHQQYRDWLTTESQGHAKSAPVYAKNADCMSCRSTEGFIADLEGDTITDTGNLTWTQTCAACHTSHDDAGNPSQLRLPEDQLCVKCHTIGEQALDHEPHHAQKEIIAGTTILDSEVPGTVWMGGSVLCTDCHMPGTAKSAITGDISSHTFKPVMPDQTIAVGVPNSCNFACHTDTSPGHTFNETLGQAHIDGWYADVDGPFGDAEHNVTAAEDAFEAAAHQDFSDTAMTDAEEELNKAVFAFGVVDSGIGRRHNPSYALDLLQFANTKANAVLDLLVTGKITGTIVDADGDPIANANITYGDFYFVAGSNGAFTFDIAPGTRTFIVLDDAGEELGTFEATSTAGGTEDLENVQIGEAEEEEADMLWLYLLIIVIIIVVIVIVVVVVKKRGAPPLEEEEPMEEMAPEPAPELETEPEVEE